MVLLATAIGGCLPGLDGASCPCIEGWTCCATTQTCEREPASCPQRELIGQIGPIAPIAQPAPIVPIVPIAPIAPTMQVPMYQGSQTRFKVAGSYATCTGRVAASMSLSGFCYLAADDRVMCAGTVGGRPHRDEFTAVDIPGAARIIQIVTLGDTGVCVTKTDHTVECMGSNAEAFGAAGVSDTFTRWTAHDDFAAITTADGKQLCGITLGGQVLCGGKGFGNPPRNVSPPGQTSVWIDPNTGEARLSDPDVLRPGIAVTLCNVEAAGLACSTDSQEVGPSDGSMVMGTKINDYGRSGGDLAPNCWLTDRAEVFCDGAPRFTSGKVLLLAANYYEDSLCAIYSDGSVWCMGDNLNGELGGPPPRLDVETMVAPPNSAHVECD
jgi:hypothetical protein